MRCDVTTLPTLPGPLEVVAVIDRFKSIIWSAHVSYACVRTEMTKYGISRIFSNLRRCSPVQRRGFNIVSECSIDCCRSPGSSQFQWNILNSYAKVALLVCAVIGVRCCSGVLFGFVRYCCVLYVSIVRYCSVLLVCIVHCGWILISRRMFMYDFNRRNVTTQSVV
jgi:hypothetical protein